MTKNTTLSVIDTLNLRPKTIEEMPLDVGQLIASDEFNNKVSGDTGDHREDAVKRLLNLGVDFYSNANIVTNLLESMVRMVCPKCGQVMASKSASGNSDTCTMTYRCENRECLLSVSITLPNDGIDVNFSHKR